MVALSTSIRPLWTNLFVRRLGAPRPAPAGLVWRVPGARRASAVAASRGKVTDFGLSCVLKESSGRWREVKPSTGGSGRQGVKAMHAWSDGEQACADGSAEV